MSNDADILVELASLHGTAEWGEAFRKTPSGANTAFVGIFDLIRAEPDPAQPGREAQSLVAELHVLDTSITLAMHDIVKRDKDSTLWQVANLRPDALGETLYTLERATETRRGGLR